MLDEKTRRWATDAYAKCLDKYAWVAEKNWDGIPYTTGPDGRCDNRADTAKTWRPDDGLNWWTNGFWAGILWHLYLDTEDGRYADIARISEGLLDSCFDGFYGLHHDVGFMWIPTAVMDYKLTGNSDSRRRALHAANLLAGRYNPAGRFIRAWNDIPGSDDDTRGWAIIDCMLNIPLLYWASEETGDPRYSHVALAHAGTVAAHFIRPDGSSEHIVEFDPERGGVVRTHRGQGYAIGSAWTRGQAWALYGFTVSHKMSGRPDHLQAAKRVADYFAARIPENGLIPIDFAQPPQPVLEDSCAAAIAACGFLELARMCEGEERARYAESALAILRALDQSRADYGKGSDAILTHCSSAYHSPGGHHITMVYADYFYIEALAKVVKGDTGFVW